MSYLPLGVSPAAPTGPETRVINDKTPALSLVRIVTHVSTPTLTAIGANAVFTTAPDRGRFFPVSVWFRPSVNTGASSTPIVRLGYTNSGTVYSDFVAAFTFASSLVAGQFFEIPLKADATGAPPTGRFSAPASTPIVLYVATAGAAPCAGEIIVAGFYA